MLRYVRALREDGAERAIPPDLRLRTLYTVELVCAPGRSVVLVEEGLRGRLTEPVSAVVCWTMRGRVEGGTGVAIRLAETAGIPVFNLATMHPRDVCLAMNRIAREAQAA